MSTGWFFSSLSTKRRGRTGHELLESRIVDELSLTKGVVVCKDLGRFGRENKYVTSFPELPQEHELGYEE